MRFNKKLLLFLLLSSFLYANKPMNININNLAIDDLVKITSKILDKNILLSQNIPGNVNFLTNKPVYEQDLLNILIYVLEEKGYTLIENNDILRIVRINEASKHNLPVFNQKTKNSYQMVTNVFELKNLNVDYVASKVMHLISKSARVVTDKKSNSLIVTDFVDNIKTVKSVIKMLSDDKAKDMLIYPLQNTTANTITNELKTVAKALFDETIEKQKVEIFSNADTNAIVMIGNPQNIEKLKSYIQKIDTKDSLVEHTTKVIGLKNTEAKNIKSLLDAVLASRKYKDQTMKPFLGVDEETNNVVMIGPKSETALLEKLIEELDVDRPQVYVKAQIIELKEEKTREIGVQYGLISGASGSDGLVTMSSNLNSDGFSISNNLPVNIPDNLTAGLALSTTVNLLQKNGGLDVVSEPSVLAINNKESSIYVGERRSIKTGSTVTDGGNENTNYSREDIGLTLTVKPRISNDDKVILEVKTVLEDVKNEGIDAQPTTTKREISTTSIVTNGESIILGGLVKDKMDSNEDKVPLLGDIPVMGQLFRYNKDVNEKHTLVVILTPYIVAKSGDLASLREELAQLSQLEERYIKELELRKKEKLLTQKQKDKKRQKELEDVEQELKEFDKPKTQKSSIDKELDKLYGR